MKFFSTILFAFSFCALHAQDVNRTIKQGNDAYKKGDYKNAASLYKTALGKDSKNLTAKFNLGNAIDRLNDPLSAGKYYDDVTATTDASLKAKAFYNKGVTETQEQKLPDAIESFKQALLLTPEDDDTRENLQKAINDLKKQQEQNQPKQQQKNKQKQQPQQKNKIPNPEMMEQKFNELRDKEKQLQKMLQQKSTQGQPDKDW